MSPDIRAVQAPSRRMLAVGELAAQILVDAVLGAGSTPPARLPEDAAVLAAEMRGRRAGEEAIAHEGPLGPGPQARHHRLLQLLGDLGFEHHLTDSGVLALTSCPFHWLSHRSPRLTSMLNRAFLTGLLQGLGLDDMEAVLAAAGPEDCCGRVSLARLETASSGGR